eukprot:COSAG06_NODE_2622_length_6571_cov_2.727104_5_plen_102_part_00
MVVILVIVAALYLFQLRKVGSLYAVDDEDTKSSLQQLYDEYSTEGQGLDETGLGKAVRRIDANMSDDDLPTRREHVATWLSPTVASRPGFLRALAWQCRRL